MKKEEDKKKEDEKKKAEDKKKEEEKKDAEVKKPGDVLPAAPEIHIAVMKKGDYQVHVLIEEVRNMECKESE